MAVKPSATASRAAWAMVSGVEPPDSRCRRMRSRQRPPPKSSHTGAWKCLPLISHRAMSTALIAPGQGGAAKGAHAVQMLPVVFDAQRILAHKIPLENTYECAPRPRGTPSTRSDRRR